MEELELKDLAKEVAIKHGKALALEMLDLVLIPALEKAVAKSETPIDDVVLGALKNPLKEAVKELIEKI
jgi:hypothetical protein